MKSTIACSRCGETNLPNVKHCHKCNAPLPNAASEDLDATTLGVVVAMKPSSGNLPAMSGGTPPPMLERGTLLAKGRYEILAILGQGAMGAVYKANDRELDRWVAIKL